VGTFYRAPEPGAPNFVEVGDQVRKGQVLCIIEAMKLMNEIEWTRRGSDVVHVENGGRCSSATGCLPSESQAANVQ
jgi:biotin carboxyl carrier protein